jgi:hypothetical protein
MDDPLMDLCEFGFLRKVPVLWRWFVSEHKPSFGSSCRKKPFRQKHKSPVTYKAEGLLFIFLGGGIT